MYMQEPTCFIKIKASSHNHILILSVSSFLQYIFYLFFISNKNVLMPNFYCSVDFLLDISALIRNYVVVQWHHNTADDGQRPTGVRHNCPATLFCLLCDSHSVATMNRAILFSLCDKNKLNLFGPLYVASETHDLFKTLHLCFDKTRHPP